MEPRMINWHLEDLEKPPTLKLPFFGVVQETYEYSKELDKPFKEFVCRTMYDNDTAMEELHLEYDRYDRFLIWWRYYYKIEREGGREEWNLQYEITFDPKEYIVL